MEIYDGQEAAGDIIYENIGRRKGWRGRILIWEYINMKIWNGGNTGCKTKITAPPEGDAAVKENIRR